ncbi:hypothetical protein OIU79_004340 [Salix purpurea]|uniref:Uncharacterized protein n=1 Tax=Salix purpurea TaxID=77065 RepID=A0A9Q0U9X3_SALPP|nr:hypothetical protein OIU79_004340 [Salix purpurea]
MEEQFEAGSCKMKSELNTGLARRLIPSARPNSVFQLSSPFLQYSSTLYWRGPRTI